jgi:hypothetical protein
MGLETVLLRLEEGFWRAAGDGRRYADNLASDAVHIIPGWGIAERDPVVAAVDDADAWQAFELEDLRVVNLGDDAAALVYTARAERPEQGVYVAAITSVYRRDAEDWKLVVHQQTPLPDR